MQSSPNRVARVVEVDSVVVVAEALAAEAAVAAARAAVGSRHINHVFSGINSVVCGMQEHHLCAHFSVLIINY